MVSSFSPEWLDDMRGFSRGLKWSLLFLFTIGILCTACSPQKKLMGEWRWVTYEIVPTEEKIPSVKTLERIRKLHKYYSFNYFQSIGLMFRDSNIYEHYAARGVNWGSYTLKGKNLQISEVFLGHKQNTMYKIKKINKKEMQLASSKAIMIFERDMDPAYEAAKEREVSVIEDKWSNEKERGLFDRLVVFDLIQTGNLLEGTVYLPVSMGNIKSAPHFELEGIVAGNFAKIYVLKPVDGEKKYAFKSYELRLEYNDEMISVIFVRQRYLDKDGNLVKFLGEIDSPFPRKMVLHN